MRRRIWSETVPFDVLARPATIALLRRHGLTPLLAVRPGEEPAAVAIFERYHAEGLAPVLWPMLDDARGRWAGATNAPAFCAFARALIETVTARAPVAELAVDLEPPIADLQAALSRGALHVHRLPLDVDARRFAAARDAYAALVRWLGGRGVRASAAVAPAILFDSPHGAGWQAALGTPVDGPAWDAVSVMLYSSIVEGWSRGVLRRRDTRALFAAACLAATARFGPRAGASLGAVGTGALGDEPTYRTPAELADDVALARAAGVDDLTLFDLGGVLARPPVEPWLEAFVATLPAPSLPPPTLRARAVLAGARLTGGALGLARAILPLAAARRRP